MYRLPGWRGTAYNAPGATNVFHTVEIVANQMVVLDENVTGSGCRSVALWAFTPRGR